MTFTQVVTETDEWHDVPMFSGHGGLSQLTMLVTILSTLAYIVDLVMDIELVIVFWAKIDCELVENKTSCSVEAKNIRLTKIFENITIARNELDIHIDYNKYAIIFAVGMGLSAYAQSFASFCRIYKSESKKQATDKSYQIR